MPTPLPLLICSEAEADLFGYRRGREGGVQVRFIRGKRCTVVDRAMAELGAALQLPYCFEGTWESFSTSLADVVPLSDGRLLLIVTSLERILPRAKADFAQMIQRLSQLAPAEIVLHSEPAHREKTIARLLAIGVPVNAIQPV